MAEKDEVNVNDSKPSKEKKPKKEPKNKASKDNKQVDNDESKSGSKILLFLLSFLILLGAFILLVKLDVGGLGTNILGPRLKNVPVINLILPKMSAEEAGNLDLPNYNFETVDEAVERLKATEIMLKEKEKEAEKLNETINQNQAEIDRLKVFEAERLQFEKDKEEFDKLVAEQADPEAFMAFVEEMYPESALKIYESLITQKQINEEIASVASMYQEMKPKNAAAILEETVSKDIDMAAQILLQLEPSQAGAILAAMDSTLADKVSRYMYPE